MFKEKNYMATTQGWCTLFWTNPGCRTPTKQHLYCHLPPISQTIQVGWARHARHCCKNKDKLISIVFLWTPTHGHTSVNWPAKDLHISALCKYWIPSRRFVKNNDQKEQNQRNPCSSVGWGCRIHRLHHCRGVRPPPSPHNECPGYNIKQSDVRLQ